MGESDAEKNKKSFFSRLFRGPKKEGYNKNPQNLVVSESNIIEGNASSISEISLQSETNSRVEEEFSVSDEEQKKGASFKDELFDQNKSDITLLTEDRSEFDQNIQERAFQREDTSQEMKKLTWWQRLTQGLLRTSSSLSRAISDIFSKRKLDSATLEDLEDALIQADLGIDAALKITRKISEGRFDKHIEPDEIRAILAHEVEDLLKDCAKPLIIDESKKPFVILMAGVNGAGKTTTIGKLASKYKLSGKTVMLAAADTFRAAAIEQLKVWGERNGCPVIAHKQGADAAGVAFEAVKLAMEQNIDVLLIDTAGRLQNKSTLMGELEKVVRVIKKVDGEAPHASLLVLDATVGQNALSQVEIFGKSAGTTGLIMTKLDGTARGGILVALAQKYALPIHYIGVGESIDDLETFSARDFAYAIAGISEDGTF